MEDKIPYSQEQVNFVFDWNKFLDQKKISNNEWKVAECHASDWVTCA